MSCAPGPATGFSQILSDPGYIQKKGSHGVRGFRPLTLRSL